ncbi:hypothetical protein BLNAU_5549 [Blattamonas nauphoetae]|uniref:Uncharacterized protein n=1 Tax=Blattamonas nauphoetae TaxID=2049346 RepID=A0ABQ9Y6W3_9EUKA|nr:hypothetical protein BLNAU_5549 [Blattamonas nauphoetae]
MELLVIPKLRVYPMMFKTHIEKEKYGQPQYIRDQHFLRKLLGIVSIDCLRALSDLAKAAKDYPTRKCDCTLRITHQIPCLCQVRSVLRDKLQLQTHEIGKAWWLDPKQKETQVPVTTAPIPLLEPKSRLQVSKENKQKGGATKAHEPADIRAIRLAQRLKEEKRAKVDAQDNPPPQQRQD